MHRIGSRIVTLMVVLVAACVPPPSPEAVALAVDAGGWHTCVLETDHTTSCWGWSSFNQLGSPGDEVRPVPSRVMTGGLQAVSGGGTSTCVIDGNDDVRCWGAYSVFGGAAPVDLAVVEGVTDVEQLASGVGFHCALSAGGAVSCWGANDSGQLGVAAGMGELTSVTNVAAAVPGLPAVAEIVAGDSHVCARTEAGDVWCWGYNESGQLGTDPAIEGATARFTPMAAPLVTGATQLAAGSFHTCARTAAGDVSCWGDNFFGQLGTDAGVEMNLANPTPVAAFAGADSVAAGGSSTCALAAGAVSCWGGTFFGQSGSAPVPGTDSQPTPMVVAGLPSVSAVTIGLTHACALGADATIWCWGGGNFGQSGMSPNFGQPGPNHTPVLVPVP